MGPIQPQYNPPAYNPSVFASASAPAFDAPVGRLARAVQENNLGECPICLDDLNAHEVSAILPCDHVFHDFCMQQFMSHGAAQNKNCPLCRQAFSERQVTYITPAAHVEKQIPKAPVLAPVYQRQPLPVVNKAPVVPKPLVQKAKDAPAASETDYKIGEVLGNAAWTFAKGLGYVGYYAGKGLYNGVAYALASTPGLPSQPTTATEKLAVHANEKFKNFYAAKIKLLDQELKQQLEKVEFSIATADSVYNAKIHVTCVRALKELTEKVNEQFSFIKAGQKTFYQEGLNPFAQQLKAINEPFSKTRAPSYGMSNADQAAVKLPNHMTDEFVAVSKAIREAYANQIKELKTQFEAQFNDIQVELTKVASMDPSMERKVNHQINNLTRAVDEQFKWVMSGLDIINKEGLPQFNKTIRYAK